MDYSNFNNAGSSKTFQSCNNAIIRYLEEEKKYGGYYSADLFSTKINKFYLNLSTLINCNPSEISFISNTTLGFNLLINSFQGLKNGNIIIFSNEYDSNLICLRQNRINFKVVRLDDNGDFDFNELRSKIDSNTLIVNLCHITSYIGNENPAEKIGKIIKKINPNIIYSIDACQSIGHINIDVKQFKCDVLIGSGRKFLRGPRGTGFIYLKKINESLIKPCIIDSHNIDNKSKTGLKKDHVFENFEYSPALKVGLSESIRRINNLGIPKIQNDIKSKSKYFRNKLKKMSNINLYESENKVSGINTLTIKNIPTKNIYNFLLKKKVLTSIVEKKDYYSRKNKISNALRVSFHYYNTYKQIDYLIKCISRI